MQHDAFTAQAAVEQGGEPESVVVHVQLRPRRGATRKCLTALATLAAEHDEVSFAVTGLSKDDRVVRVTVGIDLGPRTAVAKFSPQAQAAYAFVSAIFASLYDHMPVYTAEPSGAERAAAAVLLERAASGASAADVLDGLPAGRSSAASSNGSSAVPSPRLPGAGERIPA
ncbi:MAG: hypothetical protein JWP33_2402 [Blastococcus sp.]|jgi:hypothetical protein|nr:hypothetical protein [Blastococcus sp.]